jgi:hypothetical protein
MQKAKWYHGEMVGAQIAEIPKGAKKIKVKEDFFVIGSSETHGNDHRVAVKDRAQVEIYERDGVLYMKNLTETQVYCPNASRHAVETVPAGTWRIGKAQIYDFTTKHQVDARD